MSTNANVGTTGRLVSGLIAGTAALMGYRSHGLARMAWWALASSMTHRAATGFCPITSALTGGEEGGQGRGKGSLGRDENGRFLKGGLDHVEHAKKQLAAH